mmetsp:Transcript_17695/g.27388  ORF Transcript_17695/g.27388 Transcript_17695/m.27388 type:complete len:193 (-) Transcript_17695:171-749(-)
MDSPIFNIIELVNEGFVLLAGYCLLLFTDIVPLVETRYMIGQVFFYGIIGVVVINFCLIVGMLASGIFRRARLHKKKQEVARKRKQLYEDAERIQEAKREDMVLKLTMMMDAQATRETLKFGSIKIKKITSLQPVKSSVLLGSSAKKLNTKDFSIDVPSSPSSPSSSSSSDDDQTTPDRSSRTKSSSFGLKR